MSNPKTDTQPSHPVIDRNTAPRINLVILCTIILGLLGAAMGLENIRGTVIHIGETLEEVKVQLAKNGGTVSNHAIEIIRLQEQYGALAARIKALEGK